jgi:hypothetical protein
MFETLQIQADPSPLSPEPFTVIQYDAGFDSALLHMPPMTTPPGLQPR